MKNIYQSIITMVLAAGSVFSAAAVTGHTDFDLSKFRYKTDSRSVFSNKKAQRTFAINNMIEQKSALSKATEAEQPAPFISFPASDQTGNIDAPNGELWYYTGNFEYLEIPPHDNVMFTDRILQNYTFKIYNSKMELIGTIKDKMDYADNEVRVPSCEITPVATRNFFNTDDKIEIIISLAVNRDGGGNNYRSVVYALNGEKDADGDDVPVMIMDDLVGDVIEGPATGDSDNFYITFMSDVYEDVAEDAPFWDYLMAQKAAVTIYGKALDDKGPRVIYETVIPLMQFPGNQEDIGPMISMRRGDDVIYSISYYKLPFYNRYDNPMSDDMTQREGNSLIIDLYKASESGLTKFSTTEIPVVLDPMPNSDGDPTCLFSYFSVGNLLYSGDFLYDAPGASANAPDFIITRGNYQVSTDGIIDSYFTYKNDGSLKNTLFKYADGTISLGNLKGYEPQQMFVSADAYGYLYNFVDLYSGKKAVTIEADYYYDDDSDPELLTANVARYTDGDNYKYVFELRYPLVDDDENDILRFMHITADGKFDHTDNVNMGKGVAYAQSFLSTEAVAPHAYSISDTPTYMFLVKRGVESSDVMEEELMIAEAQSEENPEGKTLLQLGPNENGTLASIYPEFATEDNSGRLFIYYGNTVTSKYVLDIYELPINAEDGVDTIEDDEAGISMKNGVVKSNGKIHVFTLDGRHAATADGHFNTGSLQPGMYIIATCGKAFKVLVK
ncbi:MAG: hypothetical protein K2M07_04780 [Muribaculaceae bacterium]|nr:hypothetical protein [Muribaculaceae bacterium]